MALGCGPSGGSGYVGVSDAVVSSEAVVEDLELDPIPTTCADGCGEFIEGATCQCDESCAGEATCCADFISVCSDFVLATSGTPTGDLDNASYECESESDCPAGSLCDEGTCEDAGADLAAKKSLPDLAVTSVTWPSSSVLKVGSSFKIKFTVKNQGKKAAKGFYNCVVCGTGPASVSAIGKFWRASLGVSATVNYSSTVKVPLTCAGLSWLKVHADCTGAISESVESTASNTKSKSVSFPSGSPSSGSSGNCLKDNAKVSYFGDNTITCSAEKCCSGECWANSAGFYAPSQGQCGKTGYCIGSHTVNCTKLSTGKRKCCRRWCNGLGPGKELDMGCSTW